MNTCYYVENNKTILTQEEYEQQLKKEAITKLNTILNDLNVTDCNKK